MRWSWNHATDNVWRQLEPDVWDMTHNPWVALQTVSRDKLDSQLADPAFREGVDGLLSTRRQALKAPPGFSAAMYRSR